MANIISILGAHNPKLPEDVSWVTLAMDATAYIHLRPIGASPAGLTNFEAFQSLSIFKNAPTCRTWFRRALNGTSSQHHQISWQKIDPLFSQAMLDHGLRSGTAVRELDCF